MIKTIFLHIGIHKTASSTIQSTFFKERSKLLDLGVLYPVFNVGNMTISNHSIPFYSLFTEHPETFHFNIRHGFNDKESIEMLHKGYKHQLREQITTFGGETLIISGEDITLLKVNEVEKLKIFLQQNTHPDVIINIIIFCRHPVSWFRSALQMNVALYGKRTDDEIRCLLNGNYLYHTLIERFSIVFGADNFHVIKLEDAVKHLYGPAGAMFSLIQNDLAEMVKPQLVYENQGFTYEAFKLATAINNSYSRTTDYAVFFSRMRPVLNLLMKMPGQKFMLSRGMSKKVWEALSDDINWLCNKFSLPLYQFKSEDVNADIWSGQTLGFIKDNLHRFTRKHRIVILLELMKEFIIADCSFSLAKRMKIGWFVMANSGKII